MNISKQVEERRITLVLDGWLDTEASPILGAEVEQIEEAEVIVLDFDKVEYISSSGLRQVVAAHKRAKELDAELLIVHVHEEVMGIFTLTGLDGKLNIQAAE